MSANTKFSKFPTFSYIKYFQLINNSNSRNFIPIKWFTVILTLFTSNFWYRWEFYISFFSSPTIFGRQKYKSIKIDIFLKLFMRISSFIIQVMNSWTTVACVWNIFFLEISFTSYYSIELNKCCISGHSICLVSIYAVEKHSVKYGTQNINSFQWKSRI